jgi:uncharacterized protein with PQ loop repeat
MGNWQTYLFWPVMLSLELVGFVAGALGVFFGLPQAFRVRKLGHGRGVSLISWLLQFGVSVSWATYGFTHKSPSVLITNVSAALVNASVILAIYRNNKKAIPVLILIWALLSTYILTLPSDLVSILLFAFVFAQSPQVIKSFKSIALGKDSAVSVTAIAVSWVSVLLWAVYGYMKHDIFFIVCSMGTFTINSAIISLELIGKRRRALQTA